jgi:hypothetical protein
LIIDISTQEENAPANSYTPLVNRLGKMLVLKDPGQAQRQADLPEVEIIFEYVDLGYFQFSFVDLLLNFSILKS